MHAVVARSTFRSQNAKSATCSDHFWRFRCGFAWQAQRIPHLAKSEQDVRVFVACLKDGRRGTFEEDVERCISRGGRSTKDMFIRDVRRSGRWFLERVAFWSIRSVGLLRWFCVTGAALRMTWHHFFSWQAQYFRQMDWKNRKTHWYEAVSSEEVSQSCFVFDVVNLKHWGCLAEFFRLSSSKIEDVSQNCRVFDVVTLRKWKKPCRNAMFSSLQIADRQIDRQIDR